MSGAALYLQQNAQGLKLRAVEDRERPDGHVIKVAGLGRLDPLARSRARRQVRDNKAALIALLTSGSPAAQAVRREGGHESGKREWREAA